MWGGHYVRIWIAVIQGFVVWGGYYIRILSMGKPFYKEFLCGKVLI